MSVCVIFIRHRQTLAMIFFNVSKHFDRVITCEERTKTPCNEMSCDVRCAVSTQCASTELQASLDRARCGEIPIFWLVLGLLNVLKTNMASFSFRGLL